MIRKRYVVGIVDASPFRFWTAHGASRFLSKLKRAWLGEEPPKRPAPVYYHDKHTGWREIG